MDLTSYAGIAAAAAIVGMGWSHIRNAFTYVSGYLVTSTALDYGVAPAVAVFLRREFFRVPAGTTHIQHLVLELKHWPLGAIVPFEMPGTTAIFWKRGYGLFFTSGSSSDLTLRGVRFLSNPKALVIAALKAEHLRTTNRFKSNFYLRRIMGSAGDHLAGYKQERLERKDENSLSPATSNGHSPLPGLDPSFMYEDHEFAADKITRDPLRGLAYPVEILELLETLREWYLRGDWYAQRSIPWCTGVLLHGPGGTGKSSLARVIAETLGIPLQQFYLNTLTDREFVENWDALPVPCVVALEDFDTVFDGREPVTVHKSLSFECVLNQISGISSLRGVLLVVTTNHLDRIDAALGRLDENGRPTRPGRIDHIVHLGYCTSEQKEEIAQMVLGGWAQRLVEVALKQAPCDDVTPAQFQNICVQLALQELNTRRMAPVADPRSQDVQ